MCDEHLVYMSAHIHYPSSAIICKYLIETSRPRFSCVRMASTRRSRECVWPAGGIDGKCVSLSLTISLCRMSFDINCMLAGGSFGIQQYSTQITLCAAVSGRGSCIGMCVRSYDLWTGIVSILLASNGIARHTCYEYIVLYVLNVILNGSSMREKQKCGGLPQAILCLCFGCGRLGVCFKCFVQFEHLFVSLSRSFGC